MSLVPCSFLVLFPVWVSGVEINMTNWQELTIHVHRDAEEAVSNLMIETGSQLLHPV